MAKKKKKGKDPAFLMYSGDFLAGTYTMNYEAPQAQDSCINAQ